MAKKPFFLKKKKKIEPFLKNQLIFGFFLFLPMAQEKERELGTIPFLVDFFLKSFFFILFKYLLAKIRLFG